MEGRTPTGGQYVRGLAGRIAFEEAGSGGGVPLVLVHGMSSGRQVFRAQLEHAKRSRRVVALDLRGMGESDPDPQARYGPEAFAEDVAAVADALELRRFVLAGHSYAGSVITAYGGAHPDRIAGLLYVDAVGDFRMLPPEDRAAVLENTRPDRYAAYLDGWFKGILLHASEDVQREVLALMRRTPREVFVASFPALWEFDPTQAAARVTAPKHCIWAEDFASPTTAHNALPSVSSDMMRGVSHWLMMDRPAEFNRLMDAFLARVDAIR